MTIIPNPTKTSASIRRFFIFNLLFSYDRYDTFKQSMAEAFGGLCLLFKFTEHDSPQVGHVIDSYGAGVDPGNI